MRKYTRSYFIYILSILLGVGSGFANQTFLITAAEIVSGLFLNYLLMIAAPIVFLAIVATLLSMKGFDQVRSLGKRVITYTLLTTLLSSLVALGFFLSFDPVSFVQKSVDVASEPQQQSYLHFLVEIVPSNIFKAFMDNKVISIAFLGFLFGLTAHFLPKEQQATLRTGFSSLFQLFLKIAGLTSYVMPIAIWAFMVLLVKEMQGSGREVSGLWVYLSVIAIANLFQGVVVIPLLLKARGLSPWKIARGGWKALLMAFFTKSSNATLPISLKVAKEELGIRPDVANFALPLCTVINMNGCAAFILTTVLFVLGINGHVLTPWDLGFWVLMSVLAAVGNAGVPMGCFFLSSALLISMNVPLTAMGFILPFYTLIDMEETALNVWSDLSVVSIVDHEYGKEGVWQAKEA